jgi:hypothetical protein
LTYTGTRIRPTPSNLFERLEMEQIVTAPRLVQQQMMEAFPELCGRIVAGNRFEEELVEQIRQDFARVVSELHQSDRDLQNTCPQSRV